MNEEQSPTMSASVTEQDFDAFVGAKRASWVRMSQSVLGNRDEAEDSVQETLATLWEKRGVLAVENLEAYTARAVWLNSIKRRQRSRVQVGLEDIPEPAAPEREEPPYAEMDPFTLESALDGLPEAQRAVVRMKYYMGFSFREIGEALKISLNTAASRCRYALEALRESLGDGGGSGAE